MQMPVALVTFAPGIRMESHEERLPLRISHDRRSIRLRGYDYAESGAYFITICTRKRRQLFGEITAGRSHLNPLGWRVKQCWLAIPRHFPFVDLDAFVIMPDHVHGIIRIVDHGADGVGRTGGAPTVDAVGARHVMPLHHATPAFGYSQSRALPRIVGSFKAAVTRWVVETSNPWYLVHGPSIWQRNYYEHIIRNDNALRRIRHYIQTNPERWGMP